MMLLVLILMLMVGVSTRACPIMCTCRNYPRDSLQKTSFYYTSVSCNAYAENITRTLDNTTRDFHMSNLNEAELADVLNNLIENEIDLPYLTNLIITKSVITNLSVESFERLLSLSLSDNNLKLLPEVFTNLTNLQALDLSHNDIQVIELEPFRTLRTLEVLNLSANSLTKIESGSFSGLNVLKCLDLSRNNLTKLDDKVLLPLSTLQHLNLSNNRLEVLNEACFSSLIMLQQLDVSWNRLARVAPGSLELPSLARLLLAGNPQLGKSREVTVLVGTGRRLQTVDASRTGLKQVPAALTHSIRTLRLAGNSIRTVRCGDLDSYPLLKLLDFTSNDLQIIEEDALGRLDSLSVLYLTDNNIHEIPRSLPEKLKVLHLEYNNIQRVYSKDLQGLTGLEVLLLSDNKIRVVDEAAFSRLVSLVTLDLSRNPVTILQPGCLSGPTALEVLRLASIGIISPAEEVSFPLSAPEHLITLDLSGSPGLARQLLADTAALAASRELQELDLSHTDLEFIRSDLLHYLPQLRVLHIKDNRLNCSQLQWLASWLRRQDEPEYRDIICASPADLWGTPLVDLQDVEIPSIQAINQVENNIDSRTINLSRENNTNIYRISENITESYTPESTNYTSKVQGDIKDILNVTLLDNRNYTRNVTKLESDVENSTNINFSNEIETISVKNRLYFTNKKKKINIKKNLLNSNNEPQIKNDIFSNKTNISKHAPKTIFPTIYTLNLTTKKTIAKVTFPPSIENTQRTVTNTINQLGNAALTEHTTAPSKQTETFFGKLKNANETDNPPNNKLEQENLFVTSEEITFNSTSATEKYSTKESITGELAIDADMTENSPPWNISTGEMSMYTNNKQDDSSFLHPGMLILTAGIMGAAAALAMLAARFTRKRRNSNLFQQEDIEVTSLPSVTELW